MYEPNLSLGKEIVEKAASYEKFEDKKKHEYFSIRNAGLHRIRILPPYSAAGDFGKSVFLFFKMPTLDPAKSVRHVCVEKTFPDKGLKCPIMDVIREIDTLSEGGKKFSFDIREFLPAHRYYVNILVRQSTNQDPFNPNQIYIGDFPSGLKNWLWEKILDPDWGNITHPLTGRDIKIIRKEENNFTKYDREIVPSQSAIITATDEIDTFLKDIPNLDEVFSFPSDEIWAKINESAVLYKNSLLRKYNLIGNTFAGGTNQNFNSASQQQFAPPVQTFVAPPVQAPPAPAVAYAPVVHAPAQPIAVAPEPAKVQEPVIPIVQPQQAAPQKKQTPRPLGVPDCFGDKNVCSESNPTCNICIHQFECEATISENN